ncbi:Glycosyl Hydrolase Family 88 [Arachidicoccus rhizosphaerae]|uniref:Glycosyl Hydrolase Family 88 n=1 Tax=Arachidicoccus rhizosphaerae TaxID=551991 RepID=A0A1H3YZS4_9BACT|nr:glycoside hydrolase family 88 protein [Arachidicoccus rhizosphaerae]SEA16927.1 Glycosyl Hydrolase Family 88 [Arachidicoccus rhizosphaerae]
MVRKQNRFKEFLLGAIALLAMAGSLKAQSKSQMKALIKTQFDFAARQYKLLASKTPVDKMPQTFNPKTGKSTFSNMEWWCSGFYPGTLWLIYEQTGDKSIKAEAEKKLEELAPMKHYKGNHDLGFMINCSFGNGFRITRDPAYALTLDTAAATLALRYRPHVHAIQSWDKSKNFTCPVIIDNMMNLELLCWVSAHTGDTSFLHIAREHANTTIKNHFRPDYSSYHVIDYDPNTGAVLAKRTWQGANDSSSWARGQAWGLYGYTMMYRFTKDKAYLNQAEHIAHYILTNPSIPADMIPYWDYDAPGIPDAPRDASAAAITASGLLELSHFTKGKTRKTYVTAAKKMLVSLSSDKYRAKLGENGDFILMHSTGAKPFNSEVDSPLSYADYYYLEALSRYKDWYL